MRLQRKNPFKTLVLRREYIGVVFYIVCAMLLLLAAVLFLLPAMGENFCAMIIDRYFQSNTVYAEVAEIFTDSEGRTNAIIGGYTMLLGEKETPEPTPTPMPSQPPAATETPRITESTATSVTEIKNQSGKNVNADEIAAGQLYFAAEGKKPQVLIVHTHTTESYFEQDRCLDETKNMIAIGNVVAEKLAAAGIAVIHDATVHDYPSYNGAYTRAAATTKSRLAENPEINVVLDIHRDAVATADGSKLSLVSDINGQKAAQVMFVVGTDAQLTHEHWHENMKLALKLQRCADSMYPGLMRPINLREQRFNQQLSRGSIIIEIGTNGNTLDEAKLGASLVSDALVKVLLGNN